MNLKQLRRKYLPDDPVIQTSNSKKERNIWKESSSFSTEPEVEVMRVKANQSIDYLSSISERDESEVKNDTSKKKSIDKLIEERKKRR
jgi:hypothetical protein